MTKNDIKFSHNDYEITQRDILYQGVFRLVRYHIRHRLFNGGWSDIFTREMFERYPGAAVLPYDPKLDRVILIEQFRSGAIAEPESPWLIEIPAGIHFKQDETLEELAQHEAMEEAGCAVSDLELISEFFMSPGGTNEFIKIFCGKTDASNVKGIHGLANEQEDIRVLNLSVDDAFAKLRSGQIKTSPAIISLFWLQLNRERLKLIW